MRFLPLLLLLGCAKEEPIRVYDAPKPVEATFTILGGMFPADDPKWIFKVSGPTADLLANKTDFDKFLASVRFPNGPQNAPLWDLPAGWKLGGANPMKMADETFLFGPDDKPFVMTFGSFKGGFDANLGRWVGQTGLTYTPADKDKYAKPQGNGWRIEITGPTNPAGAMRRP